MSCYRSRRGNRALRTVLAAAATLTLGVVAVAATRPASAVSARADGTAGGAGGARVVAEEQVGQRLVDLTIESPALGGQTAKVRLLTPDGWEQRQPGDTWPVLYLLHAGTDTYETWTRESDVEEWPELRDTLVVMPEAGAAGFYTNWWNEGAGGPPEWETFHLDELRGLLERGYGAGKRRVAAGLSMGGFGAVSYAARRPGVFQAAASYSGPVHILQPQFVEVFPLLDAAFEEDLTQLWGDPVAQRDVWEAHNPYSLAEQLKDTPVYLANGDGNPGEFDPPDAEFDQAEAINLVQNRLLAERLEELGAPVTTHFYAGTHHPAYGERELRASLPMLLDALRSGHGSTYK